MHKYWAATSVKINCGYPYYSCQIPLIACIMSTQPINILVPNGRIIKTKDGNTVSYVMNVGTAEKFRYHHSAILTNRYFEIF